MFDRIARLAGCGEVSCITPAAGNRAQPRTDGPVASRGMPAAPEGLPVRPAGGDWRSGVPTAMAAQEWAGRAPARGTELARSATSLAAYMAARTIVGRPLDAAQESLLQQAHRTVDATRRALTGGRGNVSVDIGSTLGHSSLQSQACRAVIGYLERAHTVPGAVAGSGPFGRGQKPDAATTAAAGALAAGAGHCAEHAAVAVLVQAPHLAPGQEVRIVERVRVDHMWAELHAPQASGAVIVLDAWADGPAVFHEDARFAADRAAVNRLRTIRRADGMQAGAAVDGWLQDPALGARMDRARRRLGPGFRYPPAKVYPPVPVVSDAFAEQVRERVAAPVDERVYAGLGFVPGPAERAHRRALLNGVAAAGAARRTGSGVADAALGSGHILSAACRLDR